LPVLLPEWLLLLLLLLRLLVLLPSQRWAGSAVECAAGGGGRPAPAVDAHTQRLAGGERLAVVVGADGQRVPVDLPVLKRNPVPPALGLHREDLVTGKGQLDGPTGDRAAAIVHQGQLIPEMVKIVPVPVGREGHGDVRRGAGACEGEGDGVGAGGRAAGACDTGLCALLMWLCAEMLGPGRLAPQLISPQLDATCRLGGPLRHTSMVTLAATSPRAATAMADWNQGRLPSGPGRRLALGGSRIPAGPPRGLAFMGATGGWVPLPYCPTPPTSALL
jgi:hypothetical protein